MSQVERSTYEFRGGTGVQSSLPLRRSKHNNLFDDGVDFGWFAFADFWFVGHHRYIVTALKRFSKCI